MTTARIFEEGCKQNWPADDHRRGGGREGEREREKEKEREGEGERERVTTTILLFRVGIVK